MYTSLYNRQKLATPDQVSVSVSTDVASTDVALQRQPGCQAMLTTRSAAQHSAQVKISPRQLCELKAARCASTRQLGRAKVLLDSGDLLHGLH